MSGKTANGMIEIAGVGIGSNIHKITRRIAIHPPSRLVFLSQIGSCRELSQPRKQRVGD